MHPLYAGTRPCISLYLWFPSVVTDLAVDLPCIVSLHWPLPHNSILATTPWLSSLRQGQDFSQIKAMCALFALSQISWCLSQARMKVGRSKTAAKALGGDSCTGLLLPARAEVLYAALWLYIKLPLSVQDHCRALSPALLFNC